jgi:mRNA degradation ribonuclease J1/J2
MPIHGEASHLMAHRQLAMDLGMKSENIFVSEIGKFELKKISLTELAEMIREAK